METDRSIVFDPVTGNGYDYDNQAWIENFHYARCGHVTSCDCYGTLHEGRCVSEPCKGHHQ